MWFAFSILSMLAYAATDLLGKRKVGSGSLRTPVELLVSYGVLACGTGIFLFGCGFGESGHAPWTILAGEPLLIASVICHVLPSEAIAQFNRNEMSVLRVTTVAVGDEIHFFYPVFRLMCGDGRGRKGETYSIDALIDAGSGEVTTGGIDGIKGEFEFHPVSGVRIKGFRMPSWNDLKAMLEEASRMFPTLRYIGWDVVHTDRGWCIIEGNPGVDVNSTALVDEGYVTSITVVQLVCELDEAFGIEIDYTALSKENFQSVTAIAKMVEGWRK